MGGPGKRARIQGYCLSDVKGQYGACTTRMYDRLVEINVPVKSVLSIHMPDQTQGRALSWTIRSYVPLFFVRAYGPRELADLFYVAAVVSAATKTCSNTFASLVYMWDN